MAKAVAVINPDEHEMMILDEGEEGGTGLKNMTNDDNLIPRIQIASGMSKQVVKGHDKYMPDLNQGDIFNTVTGKIYGESVKVIPVWFSKNRALFNEDFKMECSSPDGISGGVLSPDSCADCALSKWGTGKDGKGFKCLEFRNFAVLVFDEDGLPELASVSLKSTSTGAAKKWLSMIEARKIRSANGAVVQMPMEYGYYTLTASPRGSGAKSFYVWGVNNAGSIPNQTESDKQLRAFARKTHLSFKQTEINMTGTTEAADD